MAKVAVTSVDNYIASRPEETQRVLRRVRTIIRRALPSAEETIAYQIPAYRLDGRVVVYFAGWTSHYALYPAGEVATALARELADYAVSKGTIRFPLDKPVPAKLIAAIVRRRASEVARSRRPRRTRPARERREK